MDLIDKFREIVGDRVSAAPSERLCLPEADGKHVICEIQMQLSAT
ncbi:MAG: hypothetical protein WCY97_00775 [Methanothrix sp.]|jgi:hypothetical protein|uniref:Uncharacterized protein n=1 Tax=Methanothrix harundinacea TaxID=301375 RepID=A0A101FVY6_9EURY|nr:MAG: hypothetical protein XD72_0293 [Methanothrix harundinacea]MDD2637938.1 hypothetical protein [Methanothrix sp.]MDD3709261.1 hypothetical protein [Methanothrix sp.]MDD5768216.1 hypothetical protein [Methanothrix sp.]MDI9399678.1 hypothetical protein [Euryarchaeota archaeon]